MRCNIHRMPSCHKNSTVFLSLSLILCVCVCVCVCKRESKTERERHTFIMKHFTCNHMHFISAHHILMENMSLKNCYWMCELISNACLILFWKSVVTQILVREISDMFIKLAEHSNQSDMQWILKKQLLEIQHW